MAQETDAVLQLITQHEEQILSEWLQEAGAASTRTTEANRRSMRAEAEEMLQGLRTALKAGGNPENFQTAAWEPLRQSLESLSRSRAAQGQSAGDTSIFVLAFKRPMFTAVQRDLAGQGERQMATVWALSTLV